MIDISGQVFGRLTVISFDKVNKSKKYYWNCQCTCGNIVSCRSDSLKNGKRKSCGCIKSPKEKEYKEKLKERLLKYSIIVGECREWNIENRKHPFGYGFINVRNKYMGAHRASWIAFKGEIPKGMYVLHTCDNPKCINPDHLFLGTQKDNIKDCIKKNRRNHNPICEFKKGQKPHNTILNEFQIKEIRNLYLTNEYSINDLCKKFNIKKCTIKDIIYKKTWKHLL